MVIPEIYVSTDVEADGPIPGPHSMLSFGSAAYQADKKLVDTFSANLETLPGAKGDPKTMAWWQHRPLYPPPEATDGPVQSRQNSSLSASDIGTGQSKPDAWKACRENLEVPEVAMRRYVSWLKALPGKPVFVGYPAAYDFMFVYWYLIRFTGESPFSHSALDIKTYAMALLRKGYRDSVKKNMPREWFDPIKHTHVALDDAIEQGALFCNMLAHRRNWGSGK